MNDEEIFFAAIAANRLDDATRLAYADWLLEHGEDAKSEYIRMEYQMRMAKARLDELARVVDRAWFAKVEGTAFVVLLGYPIDQKIMAIQLIRELTGMGLAEAKSLSESLPSVVRSGLTISEAMADVKHFFEAGMAAELRRT